MPFEMYTAIIRWSDEDEGYLATFEELPGIVAFGTTRESALEELILAGRAAHEVLTDSGNLLKSEPFVESLQQRILKLEKLLEEACETIEDTEAMPSAHAARIRRLAGFPPSETPLSTQVSHRAHRP